MNGLQLQGISRFFSRPEPHAVLRGVDLTVAPGELLSLVGPSGSGKTTILRIIAGLDHAFGGQLVWVGGRRPKTAMVFQEPRLVPWLSILDNLLLVVEDAPVTEAMTLLADVELGGSEHAFPAQLSGGMQRRASLARALLARPDLLLLDEPFISLDAACAERMRRLLTAYWQKHGTTVLLVTHNLREAIELSTRIVALSPHEGRLTTDLHIPLPYPRSGADVAIDRLLDNLRPISGNWPQPDPAVEAGPEHVEDANSAKYYFRRARSRFLALSRSSA